MTKSLDTKLAEIHANPSGSKAFIIADAKDADMAFGIVAPGPRGNVETKNYQSDWKSLEDYRSQIRDIVRQGIVDIVLLSASNVETLAIEEKLFENSQITPAARANDTSDIWAVRGGKYPGQASRSFRTASLDHIMYGCIDPKPSQKVVGADLGLYSITFTNNLDEEHQALREFQDFRIESERKGFRYFLEVFNPNVEPGISEAEIPAFVNDHIIRSLAGVTKSGRPLFLKIAYNGPQALSMADSACKLTSNKDAQKLKTLAAAYAEVGRFPDAIKTAQTARDLAKDARQIELVNECGAMLAQFQASKPWRTE